MPSEALVAVVDELLEVSEQAAHAPSGNTDWYRNPLDLGPGLSDEEADLVETVFGLSFPPDLRYLLSRCVPRGNRFPDWRDVSSSDLRDSTSRMGYGSPSGAQDPSGRKTLLST